MRLQFLVTFNQIYIATHGLVENGTTFEAKFQKAIGELKKSEELRRKLVEKGKVTSGAKAALDEELAKMKAENAELQQQPQGS